MKCPRCGADNSERAESCYLCQQPFSSDYLEAGPPAPDAPSQAQYPPPPQGSYMDGSLPGPQAVAPPAPGEVGGYQPPPPGAYPAGIQPPSPAPKGPATVKIVIGVLVVVLIVTLGVGAYFFMRGKTYNINVPVPPGFEPAGQELMDDLNDTMKEGPDAIEVDELFVDASMSNFVIVAHMDIPVLSTDKPPSDDPEAMEKWFYEYEEDWVDAFKEGVIEGAGPGMPVSIDLYQVERLATGEAVLHMATSIDVMGTPFLVEILWVVKDRSAFFILVEGLDSGSDVIEFLKENISFEE